MSRANLPDEQGDLARVRSSYARENARVMDRAPTVEARFFYTSPLAIDDPLSPLPPQMIGPAAAAKQPPRPFSIYDNHMLEKTWLDLRQKVLKYQENLQSEKSRSKDMEEGESRAGSRSGRAMGQVGDVQRKRWSWEESRGVSGVDPDRNRSGRRSTVTEALDRDGRERETGNGEEYSQSLPVRQTPTSGLAAASGNTLTTGNPFIRAPSRTKINQMSESSDGPKPGKPALTMMDSYDWSDDPPRDMLMNRRAGTSPSSQKPTSSSPTATVPVGVSRLHSVIMPRLQMEPIYWSPVQDIAAVIRGTWFYRDTMLPVESEVANMLELGYLQMQPWTETWRDELNSAVEVGALGEMKILHRLWPEKKTVPESRPTTARGEVVQDVTPLDREAVDPEKERTETAAGAGELIDISNGPDGPDNKATGTSPFGKDGRVRHYASAGIIYANEKDAYILRPSLQPSEYYGRRPYASYIRKGHKIGIPVLRGFNQEVWDKLHPPKKSPVAVHAAEGVSTAQGHNAPPISQRQLLDPTLARAERPKVTDLILVIHGIGQKLSERMESFHFTHAMNAFRREINVELGIDTVKTNLREDMGGIMLLPVNWRLGLSFEDGGYRDENEDPALNQFTLKDITPDSLPAVRDIVSDVMLDIPYYMSPEHNPKMVRVCIAEANRIYRLWCANNPGFQFYGRVHLIAHSLGSVMATDILSTQPTHVPPSYGDPSTPVSDLPTTHFLFNTTSLFTAGSPIGFFLLLKRGTLLPRADRRKPGADPADALAPGVAGHEGQYGCLAVDNVYNIVNPYDPVAYKVNAAVDTAYAASLKPAWIPSSRGGLFSRAANSTVPLPTMPHPGHMTRLPSTVELETHNFTREEIAEKRAYLLNDNGQVDFFLRYGGGALEIKYLTMLGAHSSYWLSRDFTRMVVVEVGRRVGRDGCIAGMRAVKKRGGKE
ncbi:DDHD domain-containing protein [Eremomyces bilateralis CBS 781.70]|uniref:DDHD domain-containing protein n=1 Tax=Eremomyces bilateralis CBS 781.70 TaxID=1392243 RepID=A0A6G1GGH2_9PEZI|nr:DDHD domain-containing protein [Eremomyces bilateralis CBS 781.70]KAF1817114.1 DDHD domain-containing protein [Eremomyces bilateralis CBS 781.70]